MTHTLYSLVQKTQTYAQQHIKGIAKMLFYILLLLHATHIAAITSNMTHRVMSTSPLLYKMIDYAKRQTSYEVEPIFSSMYDTQHTIANLTPSGKKTLILDQQGNGDINPMWLNLQSKTLANYYSQVTFTPQLKESGVLLHWYEQFDKAFIDIKTAIVQCKSEIEITEVGGGNGFNSDVRNAQQAFTQANWNYGKIGESNHVAGLDNIQLIFGASTDVPNTSTSFDILFAGFGIVEAPTGSGTKAQFLFEPQVGTNHWGLGFGAEALFAADQDLNFMIGGNFRYITPAWETRSFDLIGNGAWSRYLLLQETYGLPTAPTTDGLPGINLFTQPAYIKSRNEFNLYTRLAKQIGSCLFEVSYNYFYLQPERIGAIATIPTGYGIYTLAGPAGGAGGVATSSTATINQDLTAQDTIPVEITTSMLNKLSAQAGPYATNTLTARIEKIDKTFIYGFGASIEIAQSASAISTWSVWAKFEFLFDHVTTNNEIANPSFPSCEFDYAANITNQMNNMNYIKPPVEISSQTPIEIPIVEMPTDDVMDAFEFAKDNNITVDNNTIDKAEQRLTENNIPTRSIYDMDLQKIQEVQHEDELTIEDQSISKDEATIEIPWFMLADSVQAMPTETVQIDTTGADYMTEENQEQNTQDDMQTIESHQNNEGNASEKENSEVSNRDSIIPIPHEFITEKHALLINNETIHDETELIQPHNQSNDFQSDFLDSAYDQSIKLPANITLDLSDQELTHEKNGLLLEKNLTDYQEGAMELNTYNEEPLNFTMPVPGDVILSTSEPLNNDDENLDDDNETALKEDYNINDLILYDEHNLDMNLIDPMIGDIDEENN